MFLKLLVVVKAPMVMLPHKFLLVLMQPHKLLLVLMLPHNLLLVLMLPHKLFVPIVMLPNKLLMLMVMLFNKILVPMVMLPNKILSMMLDPHNRPEPRAMASRKARPRSRVFQLLNARITVAQEAAVDHKSYRSGGVG